MKEDTTTKNPSDDGKYWGGEGRELGTAGCCCEARATSQRRKERSLERTNTWRYGWRGFTCRYNSSCLRQDSKVAFKLEATCRATAIYNCNIHAARVQLLHDRLWNLLCISVSRKTDYKLVDENNSFSCILHDRSNLASDPHYLHRSIIIIFLGILLRSEKRREDKFYLTIGSCAYVCTQDVASFSSLTRRR